MSAGLEVLAFLRARELAAYEIWRATPVNAPERLERGAAWVKALNAVNAELEHRARLLAVRTSGKEQHP